MTSRATLSAAVGRAFTAAGDLVRPATLSRSSPTAYDPATAAPTVAATVDSIALALFDRASRSAGAALSELVLEPGDAVVWLAATAFAPRPGDGLVIDGVARVVVHAENLINADALHLVVAR